MKSLAGLCFSITWRAAAAFLILSVFVALLGYVLSGIGITVPDALASNVWYVYAKRTLFLIFFGTAMLATELFAANNLIKALAGDALGLEPSVWRKIGLGVSAVCYVLALANLAVAALASPTVWINYSTFISPILVLVGVCIVAAMSHGQVVAAANNSLQARRP